MEEEYKLIVLYAGVQGIRSEDIEEFVKKLTKRIAPTSMKGEVIIIPVQSPDTRIECINPKYITDTDLINEHTEMMKTLREHLQNQVEQVKEGKNG